MATATFLGPGNSNPADHFIRLAERLNPTEGDLLLAGNYLRGEIRDRTFRDESVEGGSFAPYSPGYAAKKGQTNVDLYSRGPSKHMLDGLMVKADADSISVGIFGDEEMATRAQVHNEGATIRTRRGKGTSIRSLMAKTVRDLNAKKTSSGSFTMPRRPWLGARDEDIDRMGQIIVGSIMSRQEN